MKTDGGGVLIAVKSHFVCQQLCTSDSRVECVFVSIKQAKSTLIIGAAYIPPQEPLIKYSDFCETTVNVLSSVPSMSDIILLGDFNQPHIAWDNHPLTSNNESSQNLIDLANLLQLKQCNTIKNYLNVILDLVFCTGPEEVKVRTVE